MVFTRFEKTIEIIFFDFTDKSLRFSELSTYMRHDKFQRKQKLNLFQIS